MFPTFLAAHPPCLEPLYFLDTFVPPPLLFLLLHISCHLINPAALILPMYLSQCIFFLLPLIFSCVIYLSIRIMILSITGSSHMIISMFPSQLCCLISVLHSLSEAEWVNVGCVYSPALLTCVSSSCPTAEPVAPHHRDIPSSMYQCSKPFSISTSTVPQPLPLSSTFLLSIAFLVSTEPHSYHVCVGLCVLSPFQSMLSWLVPYTDSEI